MTIKRTLALTTLHGETDQAEVEARARENWEKDRHPGKPPFVAPERPIVTAVFTDELGTVLRLEPATWDEASCLRPGLTITVEVGG